MKIILFLSILFFSINCYACDLCPNEKAFCDKGWVVHRKVNFDKILKEKLSQIKAEIGRDLIVDDIECYHSDFTHDSYLYMWIVILDRVSTLRDEMWGDVAFTMTGPDTGEYIEIRWYDPATKKKHIVCNPEFVYCLTTKVPLAYNTIF